LHYNVEKCVFCLYSRTFIASPAMRPPPEFQSDLRLCLRGHWFGPSKYAPGCIFSPVYCNQGPSHTARHCRPTSRAFSFIIIELAHDIIMNIVSTLLFTDVGCQSSWYQNIPQPQNVPLVSKPVVIIIALVSVF